YILFLLGYVMVLLCSRFINKNLIIKNSYLKKIYIDYVPFALVTIFFIKYINLYNFEAFLILGVSLLGFYNRNLGKKFDKIISILSVTSIFIALLFIQEYNIIPTGVKLEFNFICIYIYLCALRYLLKLKFKNTVFYTYWIIALTILFLDTFIGGMIYDIIFLGMICCLILFYGIKNKNKKYMALSLLFLLLVTINNTFIFWKEFVWFIYLIIIGLIFIFVALFFESRKRKSDKDRKIKEDDEINFNDSINLSKQDILNKNNKNNYKKIETKYKKYKNKRRIIKNKIKRKQKTKRYR
uniref:hypothetical protein n=1 Tax=uncultured Tyzzerella sp. TaxID=2321398 RepID=UPI002941EE59